MAEEKRKRVRRQPSAAMLKITVEKVETVWKPTRNWNRLTDSIQGDGQQYGYVDAILPVETKTTVLEQTLPEGKFDLAKVIKAINGL